MVDTSQRKVIIVTGVGRSGTSLSMQALLHAGMIASPNYIEASEQNPYGLFEDAEIVRIQRKLQTTLFHKSIHPRPGSWLAVEGVRDEVNRLKDILENRLALGKGIWGFKDPRTTVLSPLWTRIFNECKVVPIYIFCYRSVYATIRSLRNQYSMGPDYAEAMWLIRTAWFIRQTGGRAFFVPYEKWFDAPEEILSPMLNHVTLKTGKSFDKSHLVKQELRRTSERKFNLKHDYSHELSEAVSSLKGVPANPLNLVEKCDQILSDFLPGHIFLVDFYRQFDRVVELKAQQAPS